MTGFMAAMAIIAALALGEAQDRDRGRWLELTGATDAAER
jgi:predicted outer membrane lipoprotein